MQKTRVMERAWEPEARSEGGLASRFGLPRPLPPGAKRSKMLPMDTYPPLIADLLAIPCRMPLGPGTPDRAAADKLGRADVAAVFAAAAVRQPATARACLAG